GGAGLCQAAALHVVAAREGGGRRQAGRHRGRQGRIEEADVQLREERRRGLVVDQDVRVVLGAEELAVVDAVRAVEEDLPGARLVVPVQLERRAGAELPERLDAGRGGAGGIVRRHQSLRQRPLRVLE